MDAASSTLVVRNAGIGASRVGKVGRFTRSVALVVPTAGAVVTVFGPGSEGTSPGLER